MTGDLVIGIVIGVLSMIMFIVILGYSFMRWMQGFKALHLDYGDALERLGRQLEEKKNEHDGKDQNCQTCSDIRFYYNHVREFNHAPEFLRQKVI